MKVTENAYELLWEKLDQIEQTATAGFLEKDASESCLEIKGLVVDARQIMKNEFYVPTSITQF